MGAWLLIGGYLLLITPLRVGVSLLLGNGAPPRGAVGMMIWGVGFQARLRGLRDEGGQLRLETTLPGKKAPAARDPSGPAQGALRVFKALKRANLARALLKKTVRLVRLDVDARIGLEDAALTALFSGALRAIFALLPRARCRLTPVFGGKSALRARCIVETRLGTLLAACLLGAVSFLRAGQKEEKPWTIPSGT